MSALRCSAAVPAGQYAEHSSPRMVRHGNAAPSRPQRPRPAPAPGAGWSAASAARRPRPPGRCRSAPAGRSPRCPRTRARRTRGRSAPWPRWPAARRGRRPAARGTARTGPPAAAPDRRRPRRRRPPRTRRGRRADRPRDRPSRCTARRSARRRPGRAAPAATASSSSRTPRNLTIRRRSPGRSTVTTVVRAQSSRTSVSSSYSPGASTAWSMPAAISRPLARVRCSSTAPCCSVSCATATSGRSSAAATRGSSDSGGCSSLATRLGLQRDRTVVVDRLDLVLDGGHRALGEGHQPGDCGSVRAARPATSTRRCGAARRPAGPGPVRGRAARPYAHVERLVVDHQPDELAVGDVRRRSGPAPGSRSRPPGTAAAAARRTS